MKIEIKLQQINASGNALRRYSNYIFKQVLEVSQANLAKDLERGSVATASVLRNSQFNHLPCYGMKLDPKLSLSTPRSQGCYGEASALDLLLRSKQINF
ncbi:unnamed protein product [Pieris macdunnoughi]|uniref:Uncharacterized protein n=1 Tax=Pieris macdunnoughi TaxID=345717 RepID=A0A821T2P9_9NEOP|nr:unnamed protein product [Pieris macdunnoughi]